MAPLNKNKFHQWAMDVCGEYPEKTSQLRNQLVDMQNILDRFGLLKEEIYLPLTCLYFIQVEKLKTDEEIKQKWGGKYLDLLNTPQSKEILGMVLGYFGAKVQEERKGSNQVQIQKLQQQLNQKLLNFPQNLWGPRENRIKEFIDFLSNTKLHQNDIFVLILQHPQEPKHPLGSSKWIGDILLNSQTLIGLSWPNLKKVLEKVSKKNPHLKLADKNSQWGILYLGSGLKEFGDDRRKIKEHRPDGDVLFFTDKDGNYQGKMDQESVRRGHHRGHDLKGLIILDGTWSQAKTLWWRNPWLLKCQRLILAPTEISLYGKLRKEPRAECLSGIESVGKALSLLGEKSETQKVLTDYFQKNLLSYQAQKASSKLKK